MVTPCNFPMMTRCNFPILGENAICGWILPPRELGLNYLIRLSAKNCLSRSARRTTLLLLDDPHPCLSRPVGGGVRVSAGQMNCALRDELRPSICLTVFGLIYLIGMY